MNLDVVILAAGKGTRMHSSLPKVLHPLGGKAMLEHVVDTTRCLEQSTIHVVVGFGADQIKAHFAEQKATDAIIWVDQTEQLGTGHATQQAMPGIHSTSSNDLVLVVYGDVPLIAQETLVQLIAKADEDTVALLTLNTENPTGLGRIIRVDEEVIAIVEEKDASHQQKQIQEVNSGIMVLPTARLEGWLDNLGNDNKQGEYYLTDVIAIARDEACNISAMSIVNEFEVQGVNDKTQLAMLERHYQMNKAEQLLDAGVTLRDPARLDIRGELDTGSDVVIDVNVIFEGQNQLGNNVIIGANSIIKDSTIGDGTVIHPGTNIEGAIIGENASVGPQARIRPGTVLKDDVKVGNFVETKNAIIGEGSKASHLAYIGDAELGAGVNIGAGTIICNYDGVNKHKTTIGDNVFVGSNSVLIAPVTLEDNAFIAAGSAINSDVPANSLAIGRGKQRNIAAWKRPTKS